MTTKVMTIWFSDLDTDQHQCPAPDTAFTQGSTESRWVPMEVTQNQDHRHGHDKPLQQRCKPDAGQGWHRRLIGPSAEDVDVDPLAPDGEPESQCERQDTGAPWPV